MPHPVPPVTSARRPPLWVALLCCVAAIVAMGLLRLVVFPHRIIPIAYGLPLILFVWLQHRGLLWFTVFVGLNLVQSAFTQWCPMVTILRKSGVPG